MIVVSNTSPLIAFAKVDQFVVLQQLFGSVTIPPSVEQEFFDHCTLQERRRFQAARQHIITVTPVTTRISCSRTLDGGKIDALSLVRQLSADVLLLDDRKGYNEAKDQRDHGRIDTRHFKLAEERGLIDSYATMEDALRKHQFYVPKY